MTTNTTTLREMFATVGGLASRMLKVTGRMELEDKEDIVLDSYTAYALEAFKVECKEEYELLIQEDNYDSRFFTFAYRGKVKKGAWSPLHRLPLRSDTTPIYAQGLSATELGKRKVFFNRFMWKSVAIKDRLRIHRKSPYRLLPVDDETFRFSEEENVVTKTAKKIVKPGRKDKGKGPAKEPESIEELSEDEEGDEDEL